MTTRTVQFIGKAYSPTGALSVTLGLNNVELFNGTVAAATESAPSKLTQAETDVVFTFDLSTDVTGEVPLVIAVNGGSLAFFNLKSNYTGLTRHPDDASVVTVNPVDFYHDLYTRTADHDGRYNVQINAIPKTRWDENEVETEIMPNWCWWMPDETVFSCDINIGHAVVEIPPAATEWNETMTYPIRSVILQGTEIYMALQAVPAGTQLTNTTYWEKAVNRI